MTPFQLHVWPTRNGDIAAYSAIPFSDAGKPVVSDAGKPVVVFLHGALRQSEVLFQWSERLAGIADTMFMDLPGHGRSSSSGPGSVKGMAEVIHEAISSALPSRRVLLVGESLGGAVAIAIGGAADRGPVRAVLAADPPMTTGKLWNVAQAFQAAIARDGSPTFINTLGDEAFGITRAGVVERIYYPLIGALAVPTVIVTGDIPLLPPRPVKGIACVFDDVDKFVVETLYAGKVEVVRFQHCGHLVLNDAPDGCLRIITGLLSAPKFEG